MIQWTPAGHFRHPIEFYRNVAADPPADSPTGHVTPDWQPIASARAKVETGSTRRLEAARQIVANCTHLVTVRYQPELELFDNGEKEEIRWRGRRLAIQGTENVAGMDREINFACVETQTGSGNG